MNVLDIIDRHTTLEKPAVLVIIILRSCLDSLP